MLYEVRHRTIYDYDHDVSLSHHLVRLTPRARERQRCLDSVIESFPVPSTRSEHPDHFGNPTTFLTIEGAHRQFEVLCRSRVEVLPAAVRITPEPTPPWESIRDRCDAEAREAPIEPVEFVFPSPFVPRRGQFAEYAQPSFSGGRSVLEAALDLTARLHADFTFDSNATTVVTPVQEFFKSRRGVCQDFAHLMIACLRSLGLPARYVSGYLETAPPPGQPKLAGADASHAWVSLWCGDAGWLDLDPTNNLMPSDRHLTVAWGRDFGDVSPVRGVILGAGQHDLRVAVDVVPVAAANETASPVSRV